MKFSLGFRRWMAATLLGCLCKGLLQTVLLAQSQGVPTVPPGETGVGAFTMTSTHTNHLTYLLYLPKEYGTDPSTRFPLVLFLHGSGERGTNVQVVAVHGPPKQTKAGKQFPFILVSPQCPPDQRWEPTVLAGLLDDLEKSLRVDTHREYVTGLSMGGYGTWALAAHYPSRFAAIVPICGGGERIDFILGGKNSDALKSLGVWAFHGGKDSVVPLEESQRMVSAFEKMGNPDVKLTVYPEAGHDSWTQAYNESEIYSWLLSHHR